MMTPIMFQLLLLHSTTHLLCNSNMPPCGIPDTWMKISLLILWRLLYLQKLVKDRNLEFCFNVRKNNRRCLCLGFLFLFCCKCIPVYCFITPIVIQSVSEKDCNFFYPCLVLFTKLKGSHMLEN